MDNNVALKLGQSPLFPILARYYVAAPSAVIIRTTEAELLRAVPVEPPTLDLCCGDGFFTSLIRPAGFLAGCDLSRPRLTQAAERKIYGGLALADIRGGIPFKSGYFKTVISNSSLEHVEGIDGVLSEIARVLRPGGKFYTTFASDYAYEWWPCGKDALQEYFKLQPVFNAFSLEQWKQRMAQAGLPVVEHRYYLSKRATQLLLFLDYHLSRFYLTRDRTVLRFLSGPARWIPVRAWVKIWQWAFRNVKLLAGARGGGILLVAERK